MMSYLQTEITINVTIAFLLSQGLALVSLIAACVSTWGNHRHLVLALIVDSIALTMSYTFLGAFPGAACNVLCLIRHFYCLFKERYPTLNRRWVLFMFLTIHTIIGLIVESVTIHPFAVILPIAAAYFSTIGAWTEKNERISKTLIACMYATWLIYDIIVGSPVGVINDALPLLCSIYGTIKTK